jgi:L-alanine-DL-glutamate epimerase-like enolase superfamily enzyme
MKIHTLGEAAGIETAVHGGGSMAAGQHFSAAAPSGSLTEWVMFSPAGIPLEEVSRVPGVALPAEGRLKVSDAPGLGYEFSAQDFSDWT